MDIIEKIQSNSISAVLADRLKLGTKLLQAREANGLTLRDLAELADVDPTSISLIERGVINATINTYIKLARALGVSIVSS